MVELTPRQGEALAARAEIVTYTPSGTSEHVMKLVTLRRGLGVREGHTWHKRQERVGDGERARAFEDKIKHSALTADGDQCLWMLRPPARSCRCVLFSQ